MLENITPEIEAEVTAGLRATHNIVSVENTGRRLTVHFQGGATMQTLSRQMIDAESALMDKFCYPPYTMGTDNNQYRFSLICN